MPLLFGQQNFRIFLAYFLLALKVVAGTEMPSPPLPSSSSLFWQNKKELGANKSR
jgi:hypothetical protein